MFKLHSIFDSIQFEGAQPAVPARFVRFSGCNLTCPWCDTDHVTTQEYSLDALLDEIMSWYPGLVKIEPTPEDGATPVPRTLIFTGGEPFMQEEFPDLLSRLAETLPLDIRIETNGHFADAYGESPETTWLTVSPKFLSEEQFLGLLEAVRIDEFKLLFGQHEPYLSLLEQFYSEHTDDEGEEYVQPPVTIAPLATKEDPFGFQQINSISKLCIQHPGLGISMQWHKVLQLP